MPPEPRFHRTLHILNRALLVVLLIAIVAFNIGLLTSFALDLALLLTLIPVSLHHIYLALYHYRLGAEGSDRQVFSNLLLALLYLGGLYLNFAL
jgi:uncharacterized membrane protein